MNIIKKFILFETENKSYSFDELSEESKKNAIAQIRSGMLEGKYGAEDIPAWVIDDDFLFEPTHKELIKVFGPNYNNDLGDSPMIGNERNGIYFEVGKYLHCAKALEVNNKEMFLGWLGISPFYWEDLYYTFRDPSSSTKIEFEIENEDEMTKERISRIDHYIEKAEKKFGSHMNDVLERIDKSIDSQYEDTEIQERIAANDYMFDVKGNPVE
jgi:hypothetical protein